MVKKISLSFVNGKKEFEIPRMTVKKQETIMEKMVEIEKQKGTKFNYNTEIGKIALLVCLQEIDTKVKIEDIENMHPDDFRFLFDEFWNNGRELGIGDATHFHKKTR